MNQESDRNIQDAQREIMKIFQGLTREIPIILFSQPGLNDTYCEYAQQSIRFFRKTTDKIVLREFNLDHDKAKKLKIKHSPTILFDPDNFNIRWLGAPLGEEARLFLEAVLLLGSRDSGLNDDAKRILSRIDSPRHIKVFISSSCPYCPQQAMNALKAAIEKPELISVELVDIQANPDLAEKYSAQSVPQTYANEVLIAKGAQPEELFMLSLEKMEQQTIFIPESDAQEVETDLLVVGGGPAGLTAGIYAARSGLNTVVVERGVLGGQVATTPVVENYPGLKQVGGKALVDIMVTHAMEYVQIFPGEEIIEIESGEPLVVKTTRRKFKTRALLLSTGASHRKLGLRSETRLSGHGVSYCSTCDGPLFKDKKVIIVGGGNSAVTEALHLHNIGVDVTLIHRRDEFRAQRVLIDKLDEYGIPVRLNTEVRDIIGDHQVEEVVLYNNKSDETSSLSVDGVFISIGYNPEVTLAEKAGLELTPDGFIKNDNYRTNVPGIYVAGDVVGGFKQIVTAAGQGAGAAMTIFEDLMNPFWKQNRKTTRKGMPV
jgi:thioredoxin reductase (NADPH)